MIAIENANKLQTAFRKIDWVEGGFVTGELKGFWGGSRFLCHHNRMTLALLPIFFANAEAYNPTWPELRSDDGWTVQARVETAVGTVVVSKKLVDGFPCFKGETEYDGVLDVPLMIEVAADAESAMRWSSAGVTEAETLARTTEYAEYYQFLDLPFPLSDRYWFLRGYFDREDDVHYFRWEPLVNGGAHKARYDEVNAAHPDALETTLNIGSWILYVHSGKTHVEDRLCSHPGGNVPISMQSIATSKTLPTNVSEIIQETKRRMANE